MSIPRTEGVANRPPAPSVEIVKVTPELATEWLGKNIHNRSIRKTVVEKYARDMSNGAWLLNGEAIKFAADGTMIDGQHRCLAVVESSATVEMLVIRGLVSESQDTMDAGSRRTASDMLHLHGHINSSTLASTASKVSVYLRAGGRYDSRAGTGVTNHEISDLITRDPLLVSSVEYAKHARTSLLSPSTLAFCWWVLMRIDAEDAEEFFRGLVHGDELLRTNPVLVLRNRLADLRASTARTPERVLVALVFKAWNAYRERRQISLIRFTSNEQFPVPQ